MTSIAIKSEAKRQAPALPGQVPTTLGATLYLGLVVLLPVVALVTAAHGVAANVWVKVLTSSRIVAAIRVSVSTSLVAAAITTVLGLLLAWVIERYSFTGRRVLDALLDIPLALPTAVAGLALAALYAEGGPHAWLGRPLAACGIQVAYTPLGIIVAQVFVTLPLQARILQPVLRQFEPSVEAAAVTLGAAPWQRFWRLFIPHLTPALVAGFTQAFARALGEYGAVIFIAGNLPSYSEIMPLMIATKLEQFDYAGATALALIMLAVSLATLFILNFYARKLGSRYKGGLQ
ncbi:MAG: sulfate ABC transporter permease subunit CysT [Deltaproteobacteria bacterium]|nr:sulfate ABC transporter permease subunit CysT [Deltaproteobacteria bacterium]